MTFAPLPVETDPDAVAARILDALAIALPGWVAHEGALEVALAEEVGRETAATNARAVDAVDAAIAGFGATVFGLAPILGTPATLPVTLAVTGAGDVVPEGLAVVGTTTAGQEVAFRLPAALTATGPTADVVMVADQVGTLANDVTPGPLEVVTATATVTSATATGPGTGGVDPETRAGYLDRLVPYLAVLRPGGVRGADLAVLARNTPGVRRALAVDLYDAQTATAGAERTVSVYPVDEDGAPVTAATKAALRTALEAVREVNFVIRVADPTYTPVAVTATAVAEPGVDPAAAGAALRTAVLSYLSPAAWGTRGGDPTSWVAAPVVRYLDLSRVAGNADGVAFLTEFTLDGATTDVTLDGVAALPATEAGGTTVTASVV